MSHEKDTKQHITHTAFRLFLLSGYKGTSMSDLVAATGLSKGAFYHYFSSKEELYFAVIDDYFLSYFREVDWSVAGNFTSEELTEYVRTYFNKLKAEIKKATDNNLSRYYVMFFDAYDFHPTFKPEVQKFYRKLRKVLNDNFTRNGHETNGQSLIEELEGQMFWSAIFY